MRTGTKNVVAKFLGYVLFVNQNSMARSLF
jgi:hypothetical protein